MISVPGRILQKPPYQIGTGVRKEITLFAKPAKNQSVEEKVRISREDVNLKLRYAMAF